jgi:hypothetical protein
MTIHALNGRAPRQTPAVLKSPARRPGRARSRRRLPKADTVFFWTATLLPWALAVLLLAVSMPHLASGFMTITGCGAMAGWLLAIAIDSAQVVAKLSLTLTRKYEIGAAAKWTSAGIIGSTSLMSMALNILAFLAGATDETGRVLAWTAGVLLPALVLALSFVGSSFALSRSKPASNRTAGGKK